MPPTQKAAKRNQDTEQYLVCACNDRNMYAKDAQRRDSGDQDKGSSNIRKGGRRSNGGASSRGEHQKTARRKAQVVTTR